jgi:4-amino-4-deoxy-L-arabinose transferase-like glycosyltransferase
MMSDKHFWRLLGLIAIVYLMGSTVNIMDIDAAQYASMSREMLESRSYLQVFEHGKDYLDKPPLIFWLSSLSMKILGVGNFGYKFPSFLFALLAIYSTYRFAQLYYDETIAKLSAIILATTQALFLITNDCRTDTLLMGCVAFTFWQLSAAFLTNKRIHFLLGFIGIGFGMLSKGPVALIIPCLAFSVHFIVKKEYKNFLRLEYLWGLLVIGVVLLPMCIGLYQQFDMHPEKVIDGKTGTSGLRFFFWTQSFGRITGENKWQNAVYFSYLFETMLWSFAPWILFLVGGLINSSLNFFKKEPFLPNFERNEYISIGGVLLGYVSLASSKYQLPHYIFVVYPLAAVITARFVYTLVFEKNGGIGAKIVNSIQWILIAAMWAIPIAVLLFVFHSNNISLSITGFLMSIFIIAAIQKRHLFFTTAYTVMAINVFASLYFYHELLKFQDGSEVGRYIRKQNIAKDKFFTYKYPVTSSLQFYTRRIVENKDSTNQVGIDDWLLTDEKGLAELQSANWDLKFVETGNIFPVSNMTTQFVNAATRDSVLSQYFLVKVLGVMEAPEEINPEEMLEEPIDEK